MLRVALFTAHIALLCFGSAISAQPCQQRLTASDGTQSDTLGLSTGMSGDIVVAGAWRDDAAGDHSGSAYVYRFDPALGLG